MKTFVERVVELLVSTLVLYALLRWIFGVPGHWALPGAYVASIISVQLARIERRLGKK